MQRPLRPSAWLDDRVRVRVRFEAELPTMAAHLLTARISSVCARARIDDLAHRAAGSNPRRVARIETPRYTLPTDK